MFAADILADGLERMRAETDPDRVTTHQVDLSDFDAAKAMVTEGIARLGRVHALVNCAGTMPGGPLIDVTRETFDLIFAVNARAPMATMQVVAAHMAEHGGGAIVNIASANAFKNESPEAPYNASKAALVALTKAAAHEWGHLQHPRELRRARPDDHARGGGRDRRRSARSSTPARVPAPDPAPAGRACRGTRRWPCCSSRRTTRRGSAARP